MLHCCCFVCAGEEEGKDLFGWPERFKVAAGVARALVYLHGGDGDGRPVIHRDVKSSNILVSEDFQPKVKTFLQIRFLILQRYLSTTLQKSEPV